MDLFSLIACALILGLASFIQSAVGFAYALFATPLLVWIGIPLQQVIVIVAVGSIIQSLVGVKTLHAAVPWKTVILSVLLNFTGLTGGLLILRRIIRMDFRYILLTVGAAVCMLVLMQLLFRIKPVTKVHWAYTVLAFSLSGVFSGTVGMGGPPMVLWVMAHDWNPAKVKGFYFANFMLFIPVMIVMMYLLPGFGPLNRPVLTALAFFPVIVTGGFLGLRASRKMSSGTLYHLTSVFLLLTGVSAMISAWARF